MQITDNARESLTKDWTPDTWAKKYRRIEMSVKGCGYPAIIIMVMYACLTKNCEMILPVCLLMSTVFAITIAYRLIHVYRIASILDVDREAQRFLDVLFEAEKHVGFLMMGWIHTEQARAEIALGKTYAAKDILNAEGMKHGMNQFYPTRRIELLGICAIMDRDEEAFKNCEKELEELSRAKRKCGCADNTQQKIKEVRVNWKYLQEKFEI